MLVLHTFSTVSNDGCIFAFQSTQDASIAYKVSVVSVPSTVPINSSEPMPVGKVITSNVLTPNPQHFSNRHIDITLDEHNNSLQIEGSCAMPRL